MLGGITDPDLGDFRTAITQSGKARICGAPRCSTWISLSMPPPVLLVKKKCYLYADQRALTDEESGITSTPHKLLMSAEELAEDKQNVEWVMEEGAYKFQLISFSPESSCSNGAVVLFPLTFLI